MWVLFLGVHLWLAYLGTGPEASSFQDVELYRQWVDAGLTRGEWPVLDGPWVYPVGALPVMLAPVVGATAGYALSWCLVVTALDALAVALLLRARAGRVGATWWLLFVAALGPVAMGRIDAMVAPMSVVALLLALRRPAAATALLTFAAWVKVAPGAAVLALLPLIEAALPESARPHWGKLFTLDAGALRERYPRWDDFAALRARLDPERRFENDFIRRLGL